jgi:putative ABC transport system permease protein
MLDSLRQDLRFALRSLSRSPLFATIAVVTLALGIGGTTAIFSVVDGVLIRELPYRDASSLVSVWRAWPTWRGQGLLDGVWDHIQFDLANYHSVRDNAATLGHIEAHAARRMVLTGDDRAEEISIGRASGGLFELLGVRPEIGRTFVAEEAFPAAANGARVALLSHQLWKSRFGGDAGILGRPILLGGDSYEVIGVLPAHFRLVSDMVSAYENGGAIDPGIRDVWIPLGAAQADCGNCLEILARLFPGRTTVEARAEVQRLLIDNPGDEPGQLARVVAHKERITQGFGTPLLVLFGAAGVLLLIACLNVAGLLAGEATGRGQEMAVRSALGAGRGRVARQLLTESALLGLIGAVAGVFVAWLATRALLSVAPPMPRLDEVGVSIRALAFATVIGVTTGIAFGLAPTASLLTMRGALQSRGVTRGKQARSLHAGVVSLQLALTVMLLVAGGLFGRSLGRLMSVDPGFTPERLATFAFGVPATRAASDEAIQQFQSEVVRVAGAVPGVTAVSVTSELPFPGGKGSRAFALEPDGPMSETAMWHRSVLPNYHETMGIPLLAGRMLSPSDGPGAPNVIVVSQSFAEQIWPGESALGKRIYRTGPIGEWTVVGIVGDVRHKTLGAPAEPTIYRTIAQAPGRRLYLVTRTVGDPGSALPALQRAIWSLDAGTPITESGVMTSLMRNSEADDRFRALLMWTFAALAAVLASVGIFGVTARAVAGRAREMGIRTALGAQGSSLIMLVMRERLAWSALGIAMGLVGAFWASGLIQGFLYGIRAWDPVTYVVVVLLMIVVCLVAGYVPARRVTRIGVAEVVGRG